MDQVIKAALINGVFIIVGVLVTLIITNNFPHLSPEDAYWNSQGNTLVDLGKESEAVNAFDKALESNPNNKYAWRNKATALSRQGNYKDAIPPIDRAIAIDSKYTLALVDKAIFLIRLNRSNEADDDLMKAEKSLL